MTAEIRFSKSFGGDPELSARHAESELVRRTMRQAELLQDVLERQERDGGLILPDPPVSLKPRRKKLQGKHVPKTGPLRIPTDS